MTTPKEEIVSQKQLNKRTIISFSVLLLFFAGCIISWKWLHKQPLDNGIPKTLRTVLDKNESLFGFLFSSNHLSKPFQVKDAVPKVRVNGNVGLSADFDTITWKLQLIRKPGDTLYISINDIKALPKTDIVFDFKCIEGWSQVTHWAGVRFSDFLKKYGLDEQGKLKYTGLHTPDNQYYVGIDNSSMLHPQTILCYEMNGKPLPMNQGAPLRLIVPVKYGVKHLKRIGTIFFSNERPKDYWFEQGYDYYCGL